GIVPALALVLELWIDLELRLGLFRDFVDRHARGKLCQHHATGFFVDREHSEIGDYHVDHASAGKRQLALVKQLRLILGGVLHHNYDFLHAGDQIHRAAHALHHLAGDHPVGEVAVLRDLHGAEDRQVNMPTADHSEGI